jgi:hypothetical protein
MVNPPPRKLTAGESAILAIIRDRFGDRNTPDEVFFTDTDEAALFIKAPDGTSVAAANLTNLAAWRADGTIPTDEELKSEWLPTI